MKKTLLVALAIVAGAAFGEASAAKKKTAKQEQREEVKLESSSDTLSYAAGITMTQGLVPYLQKQENFDTTYMADFLRGFEEYVKASDDPHYSSYALGLSIATRVKGQMLKAMCDEFTETPDSAVAALVFRGFVDALRSDTTIFTQAVAEAIFRDKREANKEAKMENLYGANRRAGEEFLADNKVKEGVVTLPSGLQYRVLVEGTGEKPTSTDRVEVKYEGRLIDGTVFDSSSRHGDKPSTFRVDQVVKGWQEALAMMPVGSKWQLYIPQELAYGSRDSGQIKPFSALIFDVELVGIVGK